MESNLIDAIPAGFIIAFAGNGKPGGNWLLCDGTVVKGTHYFNLYNAIGTAWGNGDGTAKSFHLPDLRGMFLRGQADTPAYDPDVEERTAIKPGGGVKSNVGSYQADAFQGHYHKREWEKGHNASYGGNNNTEHGDDHNGFYSTDVAIREATNDGVHGDPRIAKETRPKNVYIKYFIKF